ncbi:MAG TPA: hypothetical protein VM284_03720 [Candidatus Limnocylindria bacterium]|nr:hypothetical protein [Candidatus Limnocylindria bacterium]
MRPNPPRRITVIVAVVLMVVGLALVFFEAQTLDFVRAAGLPGDIQHQLIAWMEDRTFAWVALALSPSLLILGSLLPFI